MNQYTISTRKVFIVYFIKIISSTFHSTFSLTEFSFLQLQVIILLILAFLETRKNVKPGLWGGRPGLVRFAKKVQ